MSLRLNIGPGPHYVEGWTNVEVEQTRDIFKADVYLSDPMVLPFEDESADKIYAAHILEHIEWERVHIYVSELRRVLKPGGTLLIVGPDIWKALDLWKAGKLQDDLAQILEWDKLEGWEAPRHFWNCHEKRVVSLLDGGWEVTTEPIESKKLDSWPVTSRIGWQCVVFATKKEEI